MVEKKGKPGAGAKTAQNAETAATRVGRSRVARIIAVSFVVAACGSRTGLLIPGGDDDDQSDSGPGSDGSVTFPDDGASDFDAGFTFDSDLPPIDATLPDVPLPNDCPDADSTLVYVLSENNALYSFFPPTLSFQNIGNIVCPNSGGNQPYSMAVDRKGKAYSVFNDGTLYQISTATAACAATGYAPMQLGWQEFGMGFSGTATTETLFVAEGDNDPSLGLGTIDTTTFKLSKVGSFTQPLDRCELTGTGDGRLFSFCVNAGSNGSVIAQIDPTNATVIAENNLRIGAGADAFAFAFWGGSFWIFTSSNTPPTTVTQYDLDTGMETNVATLDDIIVGAGVSTCAPR